jgi:hypothetical protein
MSKIADDHSLRQSLNDLPIEQQRMMAARFVNCVADLTRDEVLLEAIKTAMAPDASPSSRNNAYKNAKSIAIKTYTSCGRDTDWLAQAEHFVAAGCTAALTPDETLGEHVNPAWRAAMQARMARNCAMIEADEIDDGNEHQRQYQLTEAFLASAPGSSAGAQAG